MTTRKAEAPITAPTGKWGKARRQLLSHHSFFTFDPEGQGAVARHEEKRKRLSLPRQAMFFRRKARSPV